MPADFPLWPGAGQFVPADMLSLFNADLGVGGDMSKWTAGVPEAGVPETACLPMF